MPNLNIIVAYRGDRLAELARVASNSDSTDDLSRLNQRIQQGNGILKAWAEGKGGRSIAQVGDGGRLEVCADHLSELSGIVDQYKQEVGSTVSVGIGVRLSESEKALEYAAKTGGDRIELYTEELAADLEELDEPDNEIKIFNSYLDKAEKEPLNDKTAGGGMTGASMSHPSAPEKPTEGSEHSENEALQSMQEGQPAPAQPPDLAGEFSQLSDQSQASEQQGQQSQQGQEEGQKKEGDTRSAIIDVLKQFKAQAPLWEQLKESQPEAYKTLIGVMQAMLALGKQVYGEDEQKQQGEQVQKSEDDYFDKSTLPVAPMHTTVEGFMGQLKGLPKGGPERGKLITSHMNHGPFLSSLQVHPQGPQIHSMLTQFMNSKANAGVGVGAKVVAKNELAKRSKNVREQTRNITPAQATSRLEQYQNKVGITSSSEGHNDPALVTHKGKPAYNNDIYNDPDVANFTPAHEVGHILNMPHDTTPEQHQQWMDTDKYDADHKDDEMQSSILGILAGRRAGIGPQMADQFAATDHKLKANSQSKAKRANFIGDKKEANQRMSNIDNGIVGFVGNKLKALSSIHANINRRVVKSEEELVKRSKNVREQTRNLTPDQAKGRLEQYQNKIGVTSAPTAPAKLGLKGKLLGMVGHKPRVKPAISTQNGKPGYNSATPFEGGDEDFTHAHEVGHILNMPENTTPEQHQQWMDGKVDVPGINHATDEDQASFLGIKAGRRAGISPELADRYQVDEAKMRASSDNNERNKVFAANRDEANKRINQIDNGQMGFIGNKMSTLNSIHAKINSKVTKAGLSMGVHHALTAGATGRHQVVLPVGSQLDASASASRNVGRIKILDPETQKTHWRSVRAGMIMAPDGTPTSSRNPSGGKGQ